MILWLYYVISAVVGELDVEKDESIDWTSVRADVMHSMKIED